jgi:hypothetical protein
MLLEKADLDYTVAKDPPDRNFTDIAAPGDPELEALPSGFANNFAEAIRTLHALRAAEVTAIKWG